MVRKPEFDEMTLITEESTINEPQNMAKKEEYLQELHRQINGGHSQQDGEFQFYPGGDNKHSKTVKANKNNAQALTGGNKTNGAAASAYQGEGGIGNK